jgi:hypothetical protein
MPNKEVIAKSFALKNGYDGVTFQEIWNGNNVFVAENNNSEEQIIGYPTFIVISSTNAASFADETETFAILGLTPMPEGFSQSLV